MAEQAAGFIGLGLALVGELERLPHEAAQDVDVQRLGDEVERAGLEGLDRGLDVAEGGDHGDRGVGEAGGDVADQLQPGAVGQAHRSEEHTSELQSLMRISYAVFCLKKKKKNTKIKNTQLDRHELSSSRITTVNTITTLHTH